jgi:hypothetical protein
MAKKNALFDSNLLTWRQQLNPLAHLTMSRLVMFFHNNEMGYFSDLMWMYRFVEKRDAVLRAVKHRRLAAIKKLSWQIKIKEGQEDNSVAKQQQEFLQTAYEGIDNLQKAFEFLALASFRGFSHLEKHYSNDGDVIHLEPVPQWLWCRKLPLKDWLYNPRALQTATGIPIEVTDFIIRECDDPIDEPCTVHFIRKNMSQKDWDAFIEVFGIPPIFVELPLGVGTPGSASGGESDFQILAERVISDGRGVLPNGAKLVTPTAGTTSVNPFEGHIRYQDEQIVLAATSGLLTTLTANTGMNGDSQSQSHDEAFADLAMAEAGDISEVFQTQFDKALLNKEFPNQDVLVYFELAQGEVKDENAVDDAVKLKQAGYQIDKEQLAEKTGYKLEEVQIGPDGMPMQGGGDDSSNGPETANDSGAEQPPDSENDDNYPAYMRSGFPFLVNSARKDFEPITQELNRIINSRDNQLVDELNKLSNRLPEIISKMNIRPRTIEAFQKIINCKNN